VPRNYSTSLSAVVWEDIFFRSVIEDLVHALRACANSEGEEARSGARIGVHVAVIRNAIPESFRTSGRSTITTLRDLWSVSMVGQILMVAIAPLTVKMPQGPRNTFN